jgi:hypothetical protein
VKRKISITLIGCARNSASGEFQKPCPITAFLSEVFVLPYTCEVLPLAPLNSIMESCQSSITTFQSIIAVDFLEDLTGDYKDGEQRESNKDSGGSSGPVELILIDARGPHTDFICISNVQSPCTNNCTKRGEGTMNINVNVTSQCTRSFPAAQIRLTCKHRVPQNPISQPK